ncbi:hypothetical protein CEXT_136481 [Caerostris extrusa]|uniref:Uncharacterized protein n=1 Tax=Caerostris extrusa TaxID=172846 RepID=A0AAV4U280_CAEEX|nr:hypothetical protein CEXT_136481 [Caerostris extrusa]
MRHGLSRPSDTFHGSQGFSDGPPLGFSAGPSSKFTVIAQERTVKGLGICAHAKQKGEGVGHCSLLLLGFVTSSDIVCQRSDTIVGGRHKRFIVFLELDNLVLGTPVGAAGALLGCLAKVPVMEQSGMAI